ncbi:MAG: hypothetical protein EOP48_19885 [Sphingobacteriales bacterium]|nr:MAG: hypothetical protein EOP48_19885 [Sphingobacteriales bacterium]
MSIEKLITDEEIENNQDFFEQCAKDYRNLSGELIQKLADRHRIRIDPDFPLNSFAELKGKKQGGQIDGWAYFFHGYHCGFRHKQTGQLIETSFVFGLEFGELDPYFFTKFIKSTPAYQPLPVDIYEDYADGVRINEKMISLGLFETIPSNVPNHSGVVVTDRNKIEINVYEEVPKIAGKRKFSLLRFLGLR